VIENSDLIGRTKNTFVKTMNVARPSEKILPATKAYIYHGYKNYRNTITHEILEH
jgi:hypothetical protein